MGSLWSLLFGRRITVNSESYQVVRQIGEGGFSYVYLVRDRNGRQLALKQLLIQVPEQETAMQDEVATHTAVSQSANVLHLVDSQLVKGSSSSDNSIGYLLFPFYQNGTLLDEMERRRGQRAGIPEQVLLKWFLSACHGLQAMHNCQSGSLSHRDVKPGNMLLSDDKTQLVLMDLGSAARIPVTITNRKEALALQEHCAQTCTAQFRAPELFEVSSDCAITGAADVWSLGCSLFAAAFSQSPCDGSALSAVSGRITFPKDSSYSKEFCDLIGWMLTVDPAQRPSVDQVEERIQSLISNES